MNKVREKQLGALGLCAFSVPGILYLPQSNWLWLTVIPAVSMLIVTMGKPLDREAWSKFPGVLLIPLFLWNVFMVGKLVWDISGIQGVRSPLPGLLLLLLAAYAVKKKVLPVVGAVLVFFLVGIYGVLYIFALPEVSLERTIEETKWDPAGGTWGFLPLLLLYMYKDEDRKPHWIRAFLGMILVIGAALITKGMGAQDFYTASKSVNVLGTMERLEPFVAAAVTAGGFCLMGMLFQVNENIWEILWKKKKKYPVEIIMIIGGMGICLIPKVESGIIDFGTTVCWGMIPILTQLVVSGKKDEKKSKKLKKTLDKS